jgi:hypothetical protein
MRGIVRNTD